MSGITLGNFAWWRWARGHARALARPWRIGLGIFFDLQVAYILVFVLAPHFSRRPHLLLPRWMLGGFYIWDLLVLPTTIGVIVLVAIVQFVIRRTKKKPAHQAVENVTTEPKLTRRQILGAAAIAVPPLVGAGATAWGMSQLGSLRLREIDVPIPGLPPPLDGLTIAQVSDTHIGRFTRQGALDAVVETTNRLRADLVVFTGDLIDLSLTDFAAGVELVNRFDPRLGLVMIEGNHDLLDDPDEFERRSKESGLPMLLDETRTIPVRGEPIQFLGIRWGQTTDGGRRRSSNSVIRDSVTRLLAQRDPGAFPILLAHHPHAFDTAKEAGIPLTLSGHTHGGQLMLTERLGAGPIMFRYWSGLYTSGNSSLVVSNGAGNWFPLRIHAPAEIVKLTLRAV